MRHIVSTKDWDSYAKAAWISRTIKEGDMSVSDISTMIGDRNSTIKDFCLDIISLNKWSLLGSIIKMIV